jgi:hypothetical protein
MGDARERWSTVEWTKERKGWIFLTHKPTMRERVRPLVSLWLDLLVLRLMNEGRTGKKPVWFVLDELASLQRLPQLITAITENRKSNNPMVLGFQGKAQLETLYGHMAEVMLSLPATKIFLKTSEPNAAEWISRVIGEMEVERFRETRTHGEFPRSRNSESEQRDIYREPLVMASEISGLDALHGFLKYEISWCGCAFRTWSWRTGNRHSSSGGPQRRQSPRRLCSRSRCRNRCPFRPSRTKGRKSSFISRHGDHLQTDQREPGADVSPGRVSERQRELLHRRRQDPRRVARQAGRETGPGGRRE